MRRREMEERGGQISSIDEPLVASHLDKLIKRLGASDIQAMDDDFLTFEEKKSMKVYENMDVESMLKELLRAEYGEPEGRLMKAAEALNRFAGRYRAPGLLLFLTTILVWVLLNTGLHASIPVLETGALSWLTNFDPFPFKLLSFLMGIVATGLAQVILLGQKRFSEVEKKKAQFQFLLHFEQKINVKILKHKIDLIQKKNDTLYKIHEELLLLLPGLAKTVAKDTSKLVLEGMLEKDGLKHR
jgi:uncharacterized membrane protein